MQVDLVKRVFKKDNKSYTFCYLRCESGKLIPINVRLEKDKDSGEVKNYSDNDILKALATKIN